MANQKSVLFTTSYILALAVSFFIQLSNNMLYSTIGIYAKGFTSVEYYIGLATSGFTFAALFTKLFTGKIFDFFSSRKILFAHRRAYPARTGIRYIRSSHLHHHRQFVPARPPLGVGRLQYDAHHPNHRYRSGHSFKYHPQRRRAIYADLLFTNRLGRIMSVRLASDQIRGACR